MQWCIFYRNKIHFNKFILKYSTSAVISVARYADEM